MFSEQVVTDVKSGFIYVILLPK